MKIKDLRNDVEYILAMNNFVNIISKKIELDKIQEQELKYKINQIVEHVENE